MWAQDFLARYPTKRHVLNDSWTPSGPIHIGSFRSMVIHDVLRRALEMEKKEVTYLYGFDDYDPMDGIPTGFRGYEEHLGKPLVNVPPRSKQFDSYADEFIAENKNNQAILGVKTEGYRTSELYRSGRFNEAIKKVLDKAAVIRKIYKEVSGSNRPRDWYPVQVICPNCGKLGSTYVSSWDGEEVEFECRKDLVPWAKGCGYQGKVSPLNGRAKMHWRVEWVAKWDLFDVTIEAAGKDHANKGGSFDTGARILKEVFGKDPIAAFGHEFFLLNGKKMGSTKGVVSPTDANAVFAPEVLRFLLVRTRPNQAIEINLAQIVPPTHDEYDRCQTAFLEKTDQDLSDYFYYSQINPNEVDRLRKARFSDVVNLMQLPSMKKELERPEVAARIPYARAWLAKYAPEEAKFLIQTKLPRAARALTADQKKFLAEAAELVGGDGEEIQASLHSLSQKLGLSAGQAFQAVYVSLLGRSSGPRAGVLIASQDPDFIKKRFEEAGRL